MSCGLSFMKVLSGLFSRYLCTIVEWIVLEFCCIDFVVVILGGVSMFMVKLLLFLKMVCFICLWFSGWRVRLWRGWNGRRAFCLIIDE